MSALKQRSIIILSSSIPITCWGWGVYDPTKLRRTLKPPHGDVEMATEDVHASQRPRSGGDEFTQKLPGGLGDATEMGAREERQVRAC